MASGGTSKYLKETLFPSNVKKWAADVLNRTLGWLESQEEKDLKQLTEQWNTIPYVVEELAKIQGTKDYSSLSVSKDYLHKLALTCKKIYMGELKGKSESSSKKIEMPKFDNHNKGKGRHGKAREITSNLIRYDSDETMEMKEEEINNAYHSIASKMPKSS